MGIPPIPSTLRAAPPLQGLLTKLYYSNAAKRPNPELLEVYRKKVHQCSPTLLKPLFLQSVNIQKCADKPCQEEICPCIDKFYENTPLERDPSDTTPSNRRAAYLNQLMWDWIMLNRW